MTKGFSAFHESVAANNINMTLVNRFVSEVLSTIPYIHFLHLTERSYAKHQALGEWYQGMPALIDGFVEALLIYDINLEYTPTPKTDDSATVLRSVMDSAIKLNTHLDTLGEVGLTNPLADIITFTRQTLYKVIRLD